MENEEKTIQPKAIQIFAKAPGELGVNVVKSPVKLTILSMLKINSKFLGEVQSGDEKELEERQAEFLVKNIMDVDNFKFSFLLFHTLRSNLIQEGININPVLNQSGKNIGSAMYEKLYEEDINKFCDNIIQFWEHH